MYTAEGLIATVVGLILGLIGAPTLLQWVKQVFKLQDAWAMVVVFATSGVLGAVALFVTGELTAQQFTFENWVQIATAIITAATFAYKAFMAQKKSSGPAG